MIRSPPSIYVLHAGGTFWEENTADGYRPINGEASLTSILPSLYNEVKITEDSTSTLIDSSDSSPKTWIEIAEKLSILDIVGPTIFTGSQIAMANGISDGALNAYDSVRTAAYGNFGEVLNLYARQILRASRSEKVFTWGLQPLFSYGCPTLGIWADNGILYNHSLRRRKRPISNGGESFDGAVVIFGTDWGYQSAYSESVRQSLNITNTGLDDRVSLIHLAPGKGRREIERVIEDNNKAIVLVGAGAGHGNTLGNNSIIEPLAESIQNGIHAIMCTENREGSVDLEVYEVGRKLKDIGVLSGYDMLPGFARVKFMWLLGQNYDSDRIREIMEENIAGEMNRREFSSPEYL